MCFVIIMSDYFDFSCFMAMTQQSILHLVVNWEVFTININNDLLYEHHLIMRQHNIVRHNWHVNINVTRVVKLKVC